MFPNFFFFKYFFFLIKLPENSGKYKKQKEILRKKKMTNELLVKFIER